MTDLSERLARALGLSEEMARMVVETAAEYVKTQRPDRADRVDALLANDRAAARAARLIARWGRKLDPREDS
jgi:hypothetical protein